MKISVWAKNRVLITIWLWQGVQWEVESYFFSVVCHLAHQYMHWLASQHGCVSDTARAASWLAGILQT